MIEIINYTEKSYEAPFVPLIETAYTEVQSLLPGSPDTLLISFTENASDTTGVGGFCVSTNQIDLSVYKDFSDRSLQERNLRSTLFHEAFHIQQGFTYVNSPFTALESAIYEGSAIAFERKYAKNAVEYGDYSAHTDEQLLLWLDEIRDVGIEYFENEETWHKWAFYHPEYDQKWILYKVGSWCVDRILTANSIDILELKDKSADNIASLVSA